MVGISCLGSHDPEGYLDSVANLKNRKSKYGQRHMVTHQGAMGAQELAVGIVYLVAREKHRGASRSQLCRDQAGGGLKFSNGGDKMRVLSEVPFILV